MFDYIEQLRSRATASLAEVKTPADYGADLTIGHQKRHNEIVHENARTPQDERLPGGRRGESRNLIGIRESDSTQPARSPPPPDCYPGAKHPGPRGVTGSTRPSSTPDGRARRRRTVITPGSPQAPGWTARPPWGALEPVTARAGARAAPPVAMAPAPSPPAPAPPAQVSRESHAAETH